MDASPLPGNSPFAMPAVARQTSPNPTRFTLTHLFGVMLVAALVFAFVRANTPRGACVVGLCILFAGAVVGIPTRRPRLALFGGLVGAVSASAAYGFEFWPVQLMLFAAVVGALAAALLFRRVEPPYDRSPRHPARVLLVGMVMTLVDAVRLAPPPTARRVRFPWELFLIPATFLLLLGASSRYYSTMRATCTRCRDVQSIEHWFDRTRITTQPSSYSAWYRANDPQHECKWRRDGSTRVSGFLLSLSGYGWRHPVWDVPPEDQELFLRHASADERETLFSLLESELAADQQDGYAMIYQALRRGDLATGTP